jgi:hypothetical protein
VGPSQMPQPSAQAYSAPERFTGQPDDSSVLINQLILTNRQGKGHAGCLFSAVHGGRRRACHNAGEHDSHHEKGQTKGGAGVRCSYVAVVHLWLQCRGRLLRWFPGALGVLVSAEPPQTIF